MESEKSGFVNKMSEIWRKMQVKGMRTICSLILNFSILSIIIERSLV